MWGRRFIVWGESDGANYVCRDVMGNYCPSSRALGPSVPPASARFCPAATPDNLGSCPKLTDPPAGGP